MRKDDQDTPEGAPPKEPFERRVEELQNMADAMRVPKAPQPDDEFGERLAGFERRVEQVKQGRHSRKREELRRVESDREASRGLGIRMSIAYTIIGLPLFGYGVGWLIDRQFGGVLWAGLGMLAGAVLGIAMAFVMLQQTNGRR